MNAYQTITEAASAGGWTSRQSETARQVTVFMKADQEVRVAFYAHTGRVASARHITAQGLILEIPKGKDWAGRIMAVMAGIPEAPTTKIDAQKIRDHADQFARMLEECAAEGATQYTDYEAIQAMIRMATA